MPTPSMSSARPLLHQPDHGARADEAVRRLVEHLQGGLDHGDADEFDRQFAADVLWGSPYGMTLAGFDALNPVHHLLMDRQTAARSRYEPVQTLMPTPDVVITQVRRQALPEADGTEPSGFSEMAMYVLVRRDGRWWLAAGQNTPIARQP
ncbi:SgcJ/EcaC family oxidoreductase [Frankia sp. Cppng1_Ct_nod]|uniref:SgcJ/EcaC family oxidoreductase n=1 Tax=Frankia sp. Cppng1_Ct_nod TaxID=2897162 RepID=UPI001A93C7E3|nr:SgcJ/EcaC family oxidoreductase [Frankia sp. Cppng1_Ct_nod]